MASFFVVHGRDRGSYYPLEADTVVVGRDEGADIQIVDEMVSRRHMQLKRDGEGEKASWLCSDLGSANGVKINGHAINREVALRDGDTIEIGESKLLYTEKQIRDLDTAMAFLKERGQHDKNTIIR